jgi:hypothetical protein
MRPVREAPQLEAPRCSLRQGAYWCTGADQSKYRPPVAHRGARRQSIQLLKLSHGLPIRRHGAATDSLAPRRMSLLRLAVWRAHERREPFHEMQTTSGRSAQNGGRHRSSRFALQAKSVHAWPSRRRAQNILARSNGQISRSRRNANIELARALRAARHAVLSNHPVHFSRHPRRGRRRTEIAHEPLSDFVLVVGRRFGGGGRYRLRHAGHPTERGFREPFRQRRLGGFELRFSGRHAVGVWFERSRLWRPRIERSRIERSWIERDRHKLGHHDQQ